MCRRSRAERKERTMKLNKKEFLKTVLGAGICNCVDCWDLYLEKRNYVDAGMCQLQWEVYQTAIKQFYGIFYHFTRTDEYYGICTADEKDWLYKFEKKDKK